MRAGVRTDVEVAIARGWPASKVMAEYRVSYFVYRWIKDEMVSDQAPVPSLPMIGGRPYSSYFGPADPAVIEALVAALHTPVTAQRAAS